MAENRIILNGKTILHLDARAGNLPIAEAGPRLELDWSELARAAGLTRIERNILQLLRKGARRADLHLELGITRYEAAQSCQTLFDKARHCASKMRPGAIAAAGDSLRPAFREHLPSGRQCWALGRLGPEFQDVMQQEKYMYLNSERDPAEKRWSSGIWGSSFRSVTPLKTIEVVIQEIGRERQKLSRIAERVHKLRLGRDRAEQNLETARAELQADRTAAILEERAAPGPEVKKKLAGLQNEFAQAEDELLAAETALAQQRQTVCSLEDELTSRRAEICKAEIEGPVSELRALIAKTCEKALECQSIAIRHGRDAVEQAQSMVPYDVSDPWAGGSSLRLIELNVISALLSLAHCKTQLQASRRVEPRCRET